MVEKNRGIDLTVKCLRGKTVFTAEEIQYRGSVAGGNKDWQYREALIENAKLSRATAVFCYRNCDNGCVFTSRSKAGIVTEIQKIAVTL